MDLILKFSRTCDSIVILKPLPCSGGCKGGSHEISRLIYLNLMGKFFSASSIFLISPALLTSTCSISLILPALLTFIKLSLLPRACSVFVTGSRSSCIKTLLGAAGVCYIYSLAADRVFIYRRPTSQQNRAIAYQPPLQIQIVPTLAPLRVPEILRIASRKPSINACVAEGRCLRSHRPIYLYKDYCCTFGLLYE